MHASHDGNSRRFGTLNYDCMTQITYRITSNNVPSLIITAPLKFQKKVSSTSNNSRPLIIPGTFFRGNRLD